MDVAYVSNVVFPFVKGGAEKRIHEIGRRLAADGHEVTVYGRHFWDGPAEMAHEGMQLRAVAPERKLYDDDQRSITEAIDFAARVLRPLRRHCDDHDVVVASVFPYFPVLSAAIARWRTDTPLVTTWHEVWLDHWDDYLDRFALGGKAVERLVAKTPQRPTAVSGVTADRLARIGPNRDEITVIPNGIDFEQIRATPPAEDGYDVLFAGRLIPEKGVDTLLRAFDRVTTDRDLTLGIVGDGPEAERLRSTAATLDHSDRIDFLGFLDDYEDVLGQMRAADVFAAPSVREGFGITYAEAMAADCTVIAAQHPESAASEVIGEAGFVVPPSVDGVADALARAVSGKRPATDPVERARQFDWDAVATQAAETYRVAIARS
ncbi:glycosyltransferase family 4 protein [Haloarcula laminariae]|uniref:glycosyltransferase family 4 protein n=1 Tax=Haloarcula laminariae TaxID=2961577 RepID=UPI002406F1F1|nr:glycosyltransferase family 4 protein [Halomicroarcula sp. FL173]